MDEPIQHVFQLHKVYKYGEPTVGSEFCVMTKKTDEIQALYFPCVVWLVAAFGSPREYALAWQFIGEDVEKCDHEDFKWQIVGKKKNGTIFEPMPSIRGKTLADLRFWTQNFRNGFMQLSKPLSDAFEELAESVSVRKGREK